MTSVGDPALEVLSLRCTFLYVTGTFTLLYLTIELALPKTTRDRGLHAGTVEISQSDSDSSHSDGLDNEDGPEITRGLIHAFDGELVIGVEEGWTMETGESEEYYAE
ncbi:hypothetical protein B0H11DRAFT_1911868 [Mycena galericulata]|nr:hypothetical protein B0H11DRAFT_1911868 [Mycena galericulata]